MISLDIKKLQSFSQDELNSLLVELCENNGSVEDIEFITTSPKLKKHADIFHNESVAFRCAAYYDHLEAIKFFLTSDKLEKHVDIHIDDDYAFYIAAEYGYLEIVKYLLTSPELSEHSDPTTLEHYGFRFACSRGRKDVVEFLCNIPDIYTPNLLAGDQQGFHDACENNDVEFARYLIYLPERMGQIEPSADNNRAWKTAINRLNLDSLMFLYSFESVKQVLKNFEQSGLESLPNHIYDWQQEEFTNCMNYFFSLPEIKLHLEDKENIKNILKSACYYNNSAMINYILTELDYTPDKTFLKENKSRIGKEAKILINNKILYNILSEDLSQNIDNNKPAIKTKKI